MAHVPDTSTDTPWRPAVMPDKGKPQRICICVDEASTPTRSQEGTPWAMSWQDSVPILDADSLGPECPCGCPLDPWVGRDPL